MRGVPRLRDLNPLRLLNSNISYQRLPNFGGDNGSPFNFQEYRWPATTSRIGERWRWVGRMSVTRLVGICVAVLVAFALLGGGGYHRAKRHRSKGPGGPPPFYWQHYYRLDGYYNGLRTLVPYSKYEPENRWNQSVPPEKLTPKEIKKLPREPPLDPVLFSPYPDWSSAEYTREHEPFQQCYLDAEEAVPAPEVYAYPGMPQNMSEPLYGSYSELGLQEEMCFERFGRLGPYGYGYNESQGGLGIGNRSERAGSDKVFKQSGYVNYTNMDWGAAQKRCYEKNSARFDEHQTNGKQRVKREAYVLRTWTGYTYTPHQILTIRAMINELSLKSGGEYDVHLLLHVKNNSIPIWASPEIYTQTIHDNVPQEFWNITTAWSEQQMVTYYPEPFPDNFANMAGSSVHGVYRSAHFALQWFSQQHPEYDFMWNWEMDIRYSGHYYEFNSKVSEWAKKQPRKGLWERSRRFWIPKYHGGYQNFTEFVERETVEKDVAENDVQRSGPVPIWGPVQDFAHRSMLAPPNETFPPTTYEADDYSWGVGEDADLIVFNPLFDPALTNWVFSWDVTGYNRSLPVPPRRAAIITVARLSKRLLNTMHEETWRMRHTMFPEMWPPSVCMHHGLKAVYAPHPVYFDRDWDAGYMNSAFNYPRQVWESPFGWGEHNLLGSSFYYNSGFSGALWRRWMGQWENGEGGRRQEEEGTGRMCLRGTLHHPVKHEMGPVD
ncbi:hypothetical protein LTR36_005698 [Oleoguttula mirabilis]|uniref:Major facilitator superfamily transporter n=1 Tax=Oleoguttula mirabilis TaxID=1507867 RepID=A0AAV9JFQ1_9PEZI|nr:hypothetical protein LTR36_005698 [Oleoguttula mirabilis]